MKNIMKFLTVIILAGTTLSACADAAVSNLTTVSGNAAAAAQTTKTEQTTQADSSGDVPIPRHDENSTEYESEINAYRYPGDSLEYTLTLTNALDLVLPCMTVNFSDPVHDMSLAGAKNYLDRAMGYSEDSAR